MKDFIVHRAFKLIYLSATYLHFLFTKQAFEKLYE